MTFDKERALELVTGRYAVIVLSLVGVLCVLIGVREYARTSPVAEDEFVVLGDSMSDEVEGGAVVDVSGAVNTPGVYRLAVGSRVGEALAAAGGLHDDADLSWVSASLNLAALIEDGQKIYIPSSSEDYTEVSNLVAGKISINRASQQELETLPGIGPSRAQSIIGSRPYSRVDELVSKGVVSQKIFDELADQLQL